MLFYIVFLSTWAVHLLKKQGVVVCIASADSGEVMAGCSEHGNGPLGYVKYMECLVQLLKEHVSPYFS
jgi:hypothetical protein